MNIKNENLITQLEKIIAELEDIMANMKKFLVDAKANEKITVVKDGLIYFD